ncbi:MAG: HAD-IB family phosphatase [Actinomycetia bacterium]|nr:HAD-IB family phosphatase [Actinomycetes bacterium]
MTSRHVSRWPAYHHVIFDCDATLATVEGIDELAEDHPERETVAEMTDAAMRGDVPLDQVYERRLEMLRPDRGAVAEIHKRYRRSATPGALETVRTLQDLGHHVSVVSGGLAAPVREFATFLGIDVADVHAVETRHNELSGQWWRPGNTTGEFAGISDSPLTTAQGKVEVIDQILEGSGERSMLVGDGVSDLAAADRVDLFVGFGGVSHREVVERDADIYLSTTSLLPVIALAGGTIGRAVAENEQDHNPRLFDTAFQAYTTGRLTFRDKALSDRFATAFDLPSQSPEPTR